jgi:hypothetical protein
VAREEAANLLSFNWGDSLQANFFGSAASVSPNDSLGHFANVAMNQPVSLFTGTATDTPEQSANKTSCVKSCHERYPGIGDFLNHYLCVQSCDTLKDVPPLTSEERKKTTTETTDNTGGILSQLESFLGEAGKKLALVLVALVIIAIGLYAITK